MNLRHRTKLRELLSGILATTCLLVCVLGALGQEDEPDEFQALCARLGSEELGEKLEAIGELGRMGTIDAMKALFARSVLHDERSEVQVALLDALGNVSDEAALQWLAGTALPFPGRRSIPMRLLAARALGRIKDPRFLDQLAEALADKSILVRMAATRALGEVAGPEQAELLAAPLTEKRDRMASWKVRQEAIMALKKIGGPAALAVLMQAAGEEDFLVLRELEEAVCSLRDRDSRGLLRKLVQHGESPEVRALVAKALGRLRAKDEVEAVVRSLEGEETSQALKAKLWALGELGGRSSFAALCRLLENDAIRDASLRLWLAAALRRCGGEEESLARVEELRKKESDWRVNEELARMVGGRAADAENYVEHLTDREKCRIRFDSASPSCLGGYDATATGLWLRLLLGEEHSTPIVQGFADFLVEHLPVWKAHYVVPNVEVRTPADYWRNEDDIANFFYWYYATLAFRQLGGGDGES